MDRAGVRFKLPSEAGESEASGTTNVTEASRRAVGKKSSHQPVPSEKIPSWAKAKARSEADVVAVPGNSRRPHSGDTRSSNSSSSSVGRHNSDGGSDGAESDGTANTSSSFWRRGSQKDSVADGAAPRPVGPRMVTSFRGVPVPEHKGQMPRCGHTAVMYRRNVYLFGGINGKSQYLNHLFCHEKRYLQWAEVRGMGVVPSGRANHSAILVGQRMYVYGGHRGLDVFDDLFTFNIEALRWDSIGYEKIQGPGPCFLHAAVHVPQTGSMMILGGFHQREHNLYFGHSFHIHNRVWTGIPGPKETNPQHLQLVTATFHAPKNAVVVIGIVDEEDAVSRDEGPAAMPPPSVYLMNVFSLAWTKVSTNSSPESPIPFRLDIVWETFSREFVMMGGFHDEAQGCWYFPLHLGSLERAIMGNSSRWTASASGPLGVGRPAPAKHSQYGFFVFNMVQLNWSIVPTAFPKKILTELALLNRERARARVTYDASVTVRAAAPPAGRWGSKSATDGRGSAKAPTAGSGLASLLQGTRSSLSLSGGTSGGRSVPSPGSALQRAGASRSRQTSPSPSTTGAAPAKDSAGVAVSPTGSDGNFADANFAATRFRQLLLYTVDGAPQFQRKYAFAAFREGSEGAASPGAAAGRIKKPKPMKYLIMHGGLAPGDDYTMLMFIPVLTRQEAAVHTTRGTGRLAPKTLFSDTVTEEGWDRLSADDADDEDEHAVHLLRKLLIAGNNISDVTGALGGEMKDIATPTSAGVSPAKAALIAAANRERGGASSPAGDSVNRARLLAHSGITEDASAAAKNECLLPTLPCTRNVDNKARFAVVYGASTSVRDAGLLPYPNTPVAILESEHDIKKWSINYYQDTRQWIASKMKDVLAEDRMTRKARRRQRRQEKGQSTGRAGGGSGTSAGAASGLVDSGDDDDDDSDVSTPESRHGRSSKAGAGDKIGNKGTVLDSNAKGADMAAAAAALNDEKQRQATVRDFFDKRGMVVFNLDDFLAVQAAVRAGIGSYGGSGSGDDPSGGLVDGRRSLVAGAGHNSPGMERLRVITKRREEQQRIPTTVFEQRGVGGSAGEGNQMGDLGSAMAYVLMHNALAAQRADPSLEARSQRAKIRWRFLRALVRTGEAAFLIYRATQEASSMRAVKVSSTPGLLLAPELHLVGASRAYKVPSRPIPHALPLPVKQVSRLAEITPSGMVVYHNMKRVNM